MKPQRSTKVVPANKSMAVRAAKRFGLDLSNEVITGVTPMYDRFVPYEMTVAVIHPEVAQNIIDNFNDGNRRVRGSVVDIYTTAMARMEWEPGVDGLLFDLDNMCVEGQHRLFAVIQSGKPQQFTLYFGLPRSVTEHMNSLPRTFEDVLYINNIVRCNTKDAAQCVRRLMAGDYRKFSFIRMVDFLAKHRDSVNFALSAFFPAEVMKRGRKAGVNKRQPKLMTGPVLAAVARAWYYIDEKESLSRFVDVLLRRDIEKKGESAASTLREWLNDPNNRQGGSRGGRSAFRATQEAIRLFVFEKDALRMWEVPDKDIYPLPENDASTGIANGLTNNVISDYKKYK